MNPGVFAPRMLITVDTVGVWILQRGSSSCFRTPSEPDECHGLP